MLFEVSMWQDIRTNLRKTVILDATLLSVVSAHALRDAFILASSCSLSIRHCSYSAMIWRWLVLNDYTLLTRTSQQNHRNTWYKSHLGNKNPLERKRFCILVHSLHTPIPYLIAIALNRQEEAEEQRKHRENNQSTLGGGLFRIHFRFRLATPFASLFFLKKKHFIIHSSHAVYPLISSRRISSNVFL